MLSNLLNSISLGIQNVFSLYNCNHELYALCSVFLVQLWNVLGAEPYCNKVNAENCTTHTNHFICGTNNVTYRNRYVIVIQCIMSPTETGTSMLSSVLCHLHKQVCHWYLVQYVTYRNRYVIVIQCIMSPTETGTSMLSSVLCHLQKQC